MINNDDHDANSELNVFERISANTNISALSKYYNFEEYTNAVNALENNFISIIHINIRSLQKNFDLLKSMLSCLPKLPDVIVISETWLRNSSKHLYYMDGYTAFHLVRTSKEHGGVSIYVKNEIHTDVLDQYCIVNDDIELQTIKI